MRVAGEARANLNKQHLQQNSFTYLFCFCSCAECYESHPETILLILPGPSLSSFFNRFSVRVFSAVLFLVSNFLHKIFKKKKKDDNQEEEEEAALVCGEQRNRKKLKTNGLQMS